MHSLLSFCLRLLVITVPSIGLLAGCATVPEQVQLTENGQPVAACKRAISPPAGSTGLDADGFSLTSWNIYKSSLHGWGRDLEELSERSDLLLLQEAYLAPALSQWLNRSAQQWAMAHAFKLQGSWSGVMTISKVAINSSCAQRTQEPYLQLPKTALISFFPIRGQAAPLLVANIHGVNFTLGISELKSQFQAVAEVIERHPGPVILAGDFNTWSRARMEVVGQLAASQGLQPVTFETRQPEGVFNRQLDHVYYRGLIPLQSRTTEVESSDHNPLTVTFRVEKTI